MPRFTLHRQKRLLKSLPQDSTEPPETEATSRETQATSDEMPDGLRSDPRVTIIDELPRLLLIECSEEVAAEWLAQMPGWKLQREHRADIPDPRPKLKKPPTD